MMAYLTVLSIQQVIQFTNYNILPVASLKCIRKKIH